MFNCYMVLGLNQPKREECFSVPRIGQGDVNLELLGLEGGITISTSPGQDKESIYISS